jgi:opacity protein-like surface antigen
MLIPNKASVFGAIILLATACTSSASAQTQTAANTLTVRSDSTTSEPVMAKKSTEATDVTAGPEEPSAASRRSEVADPVAAHAGTIVAAGVPNKGHGATSKTATSKPQTGSSDKWEFQFSPYFWLASLHGNAGVGNFTTHVDESFSDIFHSLDFALMGVLEARKGKLVVLVDTEYVAVSDNKATPGPLFSNVNAKFKTFIFDPEVGYRVFANPAKGQSIDVLGGIRVWHVSTDLAFGAGFLPAIEIQGSRNWVDAIVGLRGKTALSEKVFVTGKFDLGGGGSKFTWQVFGGLGYNIKPNIALIGGYRVLDVDYNKNNFLYDMNQRGPILGLGFKF